MQLGERVCTTPEEFKAWSQNLGQENVSTTFTRYGQVAGHRQAELIRNLGGQREAQAGDRGDVIAQREAIILSANRPAMPLCKGVSDSEQAF